MADGTLIPVEEHAVTACSKNYRRSANVQIIIRAKGRRVIAVGDSWPGNRNDIVVFRVTMANQVAGHRLLSGDGAYRSAPEVITNRNKSKPFAERGPNTPSPASRTSRSFTGTAGAATRSTTPPAPSPCSTTSRSTTRNYGTPLNLAVAPGRRSLAEVMP